MKNTIKLTLTLCVLSLLKLNANNGTWTKKANISIARNTHFAFTINNKAYIGCGVDANNTDLEDFWEYDPTNNTWTQKADFAGGERREMSSFSVGNYGYAGQGRNVSFGAIFSDYYQYNPSNNTWSSIADCPVERYANTGFRIDSIGYVYGGIYPGVARYRDLYAYNPRTDSWSAKQGRSNNSPSSSYARIIELKGKAYLMGGFDGSTTDEFEEYNPKTNSWTAKSSYPGGVRNDAAGFAIGDLLYFGMGRNSSSTTFKDWYFYNPNTDVWTSTTAYPEDNSGGHVSFVINGKGYVCGGNNLSGTKRNFLYELSFQSSDINTSVVKTNFQINILQKEGANSLTIQSELKTLNVKVYDYNGRIVFSNMINFGDAYSMDLDLSSLSSGNYVVKCFDNKNLKSQKFVIIH